MEGALFFVLVTSDLEIHHLEFFTLSSILRVYYDAPLFMMALSDSVVSRYTEPLFFENALEHLLHFLLLGPILFMNTHQASDLRSTVP